MGIHSSNLGAWYNEDDVDEEAFISTGYYTIDDLADDILSSFSNYYDLDSIFGD